jgi:type VI secretion system secreted protein Hcp
MATDMFLKFFDAGYAGESKDKTHAQTIDVLSWSWGESNSGSMGFGAGGGAGKVHMQDFSFTMRTCKGSPNFFNACATGTHLKAGALLTVRKAGTTQQEFLKIKFGELLISSYSVSGGGGDDLPIESITFNFANVKVSYAPQKVDGTLDSYIEKQYDIQVQEST